VKTVVFFSSPTCHKCKDVQKYWNDLVENNTGYNFKHEDTSVELVLAQKFKVMVLPTILIMDEDREVARVSGYVSKGILQEFLYRWVDK
jgi:thioredoxin-like negative regulator of GroEL